MRKLFWKKNKNKQHMNKYGWLVWLFGFYGISTFVGYLTPNPFLYKLSVLFQTNQFSMSNMSKTFLFQAIQLIKTVLIQLIQFSISILFVDTQLNVKTVLY